MSHWLNNIPETRIKQSHAITLEKARDARGMLEFIQKTQKEVSLDYLLEEIFTWYLRRKQFDFPLYGETEKVHFTLPASMVEELDEVVQARQATDPEATFTHVVEHAIERYLDSHGALPKAWREEKKRLLEKGEAKEASGEPVEKDISSTVSPEEPSHTTTSVSSPYARPVEASYGNGLKDVASSPTFTQE